MSQSKIRVDIISDVSCPWCIIGYKRFVLATEQVKDQVSVELHWQPFEINPQIPDGGVNLRENLIAKYGITVEESNTARQNLTKLGAALDFQFNYSDEMKVYNTFKAHQLLHYAGLQGKQTELKLRLFTAFFSEQKALGEIDVLVQQAVAVGLDAKESRLILQQNRYADDVRQAEAHWQSLGVNSVPTIIFNQQQALTGAHEPNTIASVLLDIAKAK